MNAQEILNQNETSTNIISNSKTGAISKVKNRQTPGNSINSKPHNLLINPEAINCTINHSSIKISSPAITRSQKSKTTNSDKIKS